MAHLERIMAIGAMASMVFWTIGCRQDERATGPTSLNPDSRAIVVNDETVLAARLTEKQEVITLDSSMAVTPSTPAKRAAAGSPDGKWRDGTLIAEIAPPEIDGVTLQATAVSIRGQYAFISYSLKGDKYAGGVDVVHLKSDKNAEIKSQVLFRDTKVHSLCEYGDTLYLAEASGDASLANPAVLERFGIKGGKLAEKSAGRTSLGSYAATSVATDGSRLWVTTGNTGGVYSLITSANAAQKRIDLADARGVDFDATRLVVMQGTPGRLSVFDKTTMSLQKTIALEGATIPESKSTVQLIGGKALVAAGDGGAQLVNLSSGKVVGSLSHPKVVGLDTAVTVTNAAAGAGYRVYLSNGEAGVYAAYTSSPLETDGGDKAMDLTLLGLLKFKSLQSANHVAFDGTTLVVAAGSGGVKIITFDP